MARPRRKPAPAPALRLSRKRRGNRFTRPQIAQVTSDALRLRADIGTTVRTIRTMIDADPTVLSIAEPSVVPPRPTLFRIWQACCARILTRLEPPAPTVPEPVIQPAPPVEQPEPAPIPTAQDIARIVMSHPDLRDQLHSAVHEKLEGEMGQKFSANLRAVIRAQVAMAVEDRLVDL
ncbi:hypothetical protein [Paracoccus sediminilitoris]|uniref:hypothetical protein n=1 Tax=Paracoccus sediminilitoris TaxID=2202419 RepID=UPI000DB9FBEE|nr:hypothetical protein [Paracoccus sediminilitoris]